MNIKHRGIKYRIYPNKRQKTQIVNTFGAARFVYNKMIEASKEAYANGNSLCSRIKFNYLLTDLKKEYPWLAEADSTALTSANDALAEAFTNFFAKRAKYPKFHKRKDYGSYTSKRIKGSDNIAVMSKSIKMPKLGKVRAKIHRQPKDGWEIKSATVSQDAHDRFFVSVLFEYEAGEPVFVTMTDKAIGLDYASDGLFVDDKGNRGSEHKYYRESEKKLAKQQKKLSRKIGSKKGEQKSKNYLKQKKKVTKLYAKISDQRKDQLHKLSTEIANRYDIVCVESLNMKQMSNKNFGNGKSTMDNGYGMFLAFLSYKLEDRGKYLIKVDKWYPSSQLCSVCGKKHIEMKDLSIRIMECSCGNIMDRDINAAINIKKEGLRLFAEQTQAA